MSPKIEEGVVEGEGGVEEGGQGERGNVSKEGLQTGAIIDIKKSASSSPATIAPATIAPATVSDAFGKWTGTGSVIRTSLVGCGSNEYRQIDPFAANAAATATPLFSLCKKISFLDMLYYKPIVESKDPHQMIKKLLNIEKCFTGSSASAVLLDTNILILYGNLELFSDVKKIVQEDLLAGGNGNAECSSDKEPASTSTSTFAVEIIALAGVDSCAIGFEHVVVLFVDGRVVCLGDDSYGQCSGKLSLSLSLSANKSNQVLHDDLIYHPAISRKVSDLKISKVANLLSMDPANESLVIPVFTFDDGAFSSTSTSAEGIEGKKSRLSLCKVSAGYRHSAGLSSALPMGGQL